MSELAKPSSAFSAAGRSRNVLIIKALLFLMFFMFAMTTDAVGVIIPEVIKQFQLGMTAGGAFHYATMGGVALGGAFLGFLADRFGAKFAIMLGLGVFAGASLLFIVGNSFWFFISLLFISGLAIGLFKSAALALISAISVSVKSHTATMNLAEGFFAVGAIVGPAIVAFLLSVGASWKWLYVIAGALCCILIAMTAIAEYPSRDSIKSDRIDMRSAFEVARNPYVFGFSMAIMLYVGVETAIYVWMPTFLQSYQGSLTTLALYALPIFFILRAIGRFLGFWLLRHYRWTVVMSIVSAVVFLCFVLSLIGGSGFAVITLPLSGLFMSVIYPTLNSKAISCVSKAKHGTVAGVTLFFTAFSAVFAPMAMGAVSDIGGGAVYGFFLATIMAGALFAGLLWNMIANPSEDILNKQNAENYD